MDSLKPKPSAPQQTSFKKMQRQARVGDTYVHIYTKSLHSKYRENSVTRQSSF